MRRSPLLCVPHHGVPTCASPVRGPDSCALRRAVPAPSTASTGQPPQPRMGMRRRAAPQATQQALQATQQALQATRQALQATRQEASWPRCAGLRRAGRGDRCPARSRSCSTCTTCRRRSAARSWSARCAWARWSSPRAPPTARSRSWWPLARTRPRSTARSARSASSSSSRRTRRRRGPRARGRACSEVVTAHPTQARRARAGTPAVREGRAPCMSCLW